MHSGLKAIVGRICNTPDKRFWWARVGASLATSFKLLLSLLKDPTGVWEARYNAFVFLASVAEQTQAVVLKAGVSHRTGLRNHYRLSKPKLAEQH